VLVGAARETRTAGREAAPLVRERSAIPAPELATPPERRELVPGAPAARNDAATETPVAAGARRGARKEREFLAGFLALARAQPGALEVRAAEVLDAVGPAAEQVAFLRALEQSRSAERLRWLEHAVRALPETTAGPHGVSVPSFALGELAAAGRHDRAARECLRRIAFAERELAPASRRAAALGFARAAEERELDALEVALAHEEDELLVAGVVAALRERPEHPRAVRLADAFSPASQQPPHDGPAADE
jgi:hypothetical protein